ncbi:histidine phosphatase superfamily [Daldinia bambusicola]|nr:histidine phosphatase superfamily [Daldinia bambusicola]
MSVIIHLTRHAQGPHNIVTWGSDIRDPFLTAEGLQQCARVQQTFQFALSGIISSPQRRAIQTALVCFAPAVGEGLQIDLLADLQEVGSAPVCTGMDIATIEDDFGAVVNTDYLEEDWYQTTSALSDNPDDIRERARRARVAIREYALHVLESDEGASAEGDIHIAVVTHSMLIPYLTDGVDKREYFDNAEWRAYVFTDIRGTDTEATIVETDHSLYRRGARRASTSPPYPPDPAYDPQPQR